MYSYQIELNGAIVRIKARAVQGQKYPSKEKLPIWLEARVWILEVDWNAMWFLTKNQTASLILKSDESENFKL